jgi:hypothetical protein
MKIKKRRNKIMYDDMPEMTKEEQYRVRQWLALGHQEGKCHIHIYGDDGELQCNNVGRHGRCLDFRRETISDLLAILQATILLESGAIKGDTKDVVPTDIVKRWGVKA